MSTSAAGGGPGRGSDFRFRSVQPIPNRGTVVMGVVAGAALIYAFWELRVRAAHKMGLTPRTINKEWQDAERQYLSHMHFEANPHKFAFLNPIRHDLPYAKSVWTE